MKLITNDYQFSIEHEDLDRYINEIMSLMKERGFESADDCLIRQESGRLQVDQNKLTASSFKNTVTITAKITKSDLEKISNNTEISQIIPRLKYSDSLSKPPGVIQYTTSIQINSDDAAHFWSLIMTASEIRGQIKSLNEIQKTFDGFLEKLSTTSAIHFHQLDINLIDQLREILGSDLVIRESLIRKTVIDFLGGYDNVTITSDVAIVIISKRDIKEFNFSICYVCLECYQTHLQAILDVFYQKRYIV